MMMERIVPKNSQWSRASGREAARGRAGLTVLERVLFDAW